MSNVLERLIDAIESRKLENGGNPEQSYVARLFAKGDDAILKKIGEEATEIVMAAKDARALGDTTGLVHECADLWFHCLIMLSHYGVSLQAVLDELARREGIPGIEEKAARKARVRDAEESSQSSFKGEKS